MTEKELIAHNAKILTRLHEAIDDSFPKRNRSDSHFAAWQRACEEFHAQYWTLFYPGGQDCLMGLQQCDRKSVQTAINFLEVDPYYFRSGYTKEYIWKYITRCQLSSLEIERLHLIGISYTERQICREFWYMCRAMTRLPANGFWEAVYQKIQTDDSFVSQRASYLFAYSKGVEQGEEVRKSVYDQVREEKYGPV